MEPLQLLLVEDSESDAVLLLRALERQGIAVQPHRIETLAALEAALDQGGCEFVISDFRLPGFDGLTVLRLVRARDADLPFILMSGQVGEEVAVTAMREGANDFFLKDHLARLGIAVERELREAGTRRKQRGYEEERRRLHLAISQSPDAVVITDPDARIVYANPALESVSGFSLAELLGQNPRIFKSGRQGERFYRLMWDTLQRGETWRGVLTNKRKDENTWDAEATISPVLGSDGQLVSYVCTQRNVTQERKLQSQLEQSQRREAIGVLAAGIAHDFNNVLTPILGRAELGLNRHIPDPGLRRDLEIIHASAERASQLVQQILGFVRTQGQQLQALEPHRLLGESLKMLRAVIPTTIRFEIDLDPGTGFIQGDPTQLHQLLLNLGTNAAQAMPDRTGRLKVRLAPVFSEGIPCVGDVTLPAAHYAELEVTDTGCGMSPELLDKVFLPFFTTKPQGEGTGLGLSIVQGIVRDLGGGIQVESQVEVGTTFRLFFPIIPSAPTRSDPAPSPTAQGEGRILVVDDEETVTAVLEAALTQCGYQVTIFTEPETALSRFHETPEAFEALISDLEMPNLPGLELAQRVHAVRPNLPILLMSGSPLPEEYLAAHADLIRKVLIKPFTMKEIAGVLKDVLKPGHP